MLAIIGGSGLARLPESAVTDRRIARTPYDLAGSSILFGGLGGLSIVFLARHGFSHIITSHEVNYHASIQALHSIGAENVIVVSAVTSINREPENGSLVMSYDLISYAHGRKSTFFKGQEQAVIHTGFARPYSTELRTMLLEHVDSHGTCVYNEAIYDCTQDPCLATHAGVRRCRNDGVDVLSITGMPETVLAREFSISYAHSCGVIGISCITNNGNGRSDFCQTESHQVIEKICRLLVDLQDQPCPTP